MLSETLAVMTISAFILAGLVTVTGVMLRSVDNSVARMQDVDNLIRAMSAISRDASALFRARWAGAEPQGLIFSGEEGSVMFPDIEKALDGTRHLSIVRYQTGPGRGLFRSSSKLGTLAASRGDLRFGNPQVIYDGGAQFRFMFVDKAQDKGPEKKLALWTSSQTLPTSMIIEAVDPASGKILSSLRVDLRANADLGCLASDFCGRKDKTPAGPASAQAAPPQPAGQSAGRFTPGGP
jgi:hypothetical protein